MLLCLMHKLIVLARNLLIAAAIAAGNGAIADNVYR